jgi:hypothetical protein
MQVIGLISLVVTAIVSITALSVSLYIALPKAVLIYAERHGRFQGLAEQETLARGTRAGQPPARSLVWNRQSA